MLLKRIAMRGFKSFADSVEIEFQKGINAIIGPNGSGKSNIVDAVRWVLGEQSMKNLRSSKLGDVIFNGSNLKRPMGMADVALTLDNSSGILPLEFSEVCFTRRVFRSGESEFFMNKIPCRLKDIQEVLMDSGIGKDGYSIIGQGSIDEILVCRPEDRRHIFEEAAGIMKYKTRKAEAQRKIEETNNNIDRVDDILNEMENQLTPLALQKEEALEYQRLFQKIRDLDIGLHLIDLNQKKEKYDSTKSVLESNVEELGSIKEEIVDLRGQVEVFSRNLDLKEIEENALHDEIRVKERQAKELEREMLIKQSKFSEIQKEINTIKKTSVDIQKKIIASKDELNQWELEAEEEEKNVFRAKKEIDSAQARLAVMDKTIYEKERHIDDLKDDAYKLLRYMSEKKNAITEWTTKKSNFKHRQQQIELEIDEIDRNNSNTLEEIEKIKKEVVETEKKSGEYFELLKEVGEKIRNNRSQLKANEDDLGQKQQRISSVYSKYNALKELHDNFEGYQYGVKNLLSSLKEGKFQCDDIYGCVADLLTTEKRFQLAIEMSLGGALQNLICADELDAKAAIYYLQKNNLGRVTFLPISSIRARELKGYEKTLLSKKGCVGCAYQLVDFEERFSKVIKYLLGRVLVVDSLDNAVDVARKSQFSLKIVTLDGQVLNPGGSITGGSRQGLAGNMLNRGQEMMGYKKDIEMLQSQLEKAKDLVSKLKVEEGVLKTLLEEKKEHHIKVLSKAAVLERQLFEKNSITQERDRRRAQLVEEAKVLSKKTEDAIKEISILEDEIDASDDKDLNSKRRAQKQQVELINERSQKDQLTKKITELKIDLSSREQRHLHFTNMAEKLRSSTKREDAKLQEFEEKLIQLSHEKASSEKDAKVYTEKIREHEACVSNVEQKCEHIRKARGKLKHQVKDHRQKIRYLLERQGSIERQIHEHQMEMATLEVEMRQIRKWFHENCGQGAHRAMSMERDFGQKEEIKSRLKLHRNQLQDLGEVNLQAIKDYANLNSRYQFLKAQKSDMIDASKQLENLIDEITGIMDDMFLTTFEEVKREFSRVFVDLFGGGRADLTLMEKEKALESGVEIVAQPPGKRLQNLSLLSGGEKTLTAIALLFAILNMKDTPFCVLDEIEATLDDVNIERFTQYLRKVSAHTQFIVVTHRKTTMEAADVLFGISMEDTATSKVLSVKMEEQLEVM